MSVFQRWHCFAKRLSFRLLLGCISPFAARPHCVILVLNSFSSFFFPSKWTCVLNVIRTLDASTENAFAAKVTKEMAFPARKVRVEMMAGDESLSFCNGPFEK